MDSIVWRCPGAVVPTLPFKTSVEHTSGGMVNTHGASLHALWLPTPREEREEPPGSDLRTGRAVARWRPASEEFSLNLAPFVARPICGLRHAQVKNGAGPRDVELMASLQMQCDTSPRISYVINKWLQNFGSLHIHSWPDFSADDHLRATGLWVLR